MKKIRVLEMGSWNFGNGGGVSMIGWNMYSSLDMEKICADFVSFVMPDRKYIDIIEKNGGRFYNVKTGNKVGMYLRYFSAVKKITAENNYDYIHIHSTTAYYAAFSFLSARGHGGKILIHSHNSGMDGRRISLDHMLLVKKVMQFIGRLILTVMGKDIRFLACSEKAAEWMVPSGRYNKGDYTIIRNGVDIKRYIFDPRKREQARNEYGLEGKFAIGHMGRFTFVKNHVFLLEVFGKVLEKNKNAVLLLAGEGVLLPRIKEKAESMGISDSVFFCGLVRDTERFYCAIDCFVLPSHSEGLGLVAIESQAAGLKTICSDKVPPEAAVTGLCEFLPLTLPSEEWAEHILACADGYGRTDRESEIRAAGYDIRDTAKRLEKIYLGQDQ